jgi:heme exporter protein D
MSGKKRRKKSLEEVERKRKREVQLLTQKEETKDVVYIILL